MIIKEGDRKRYPATYEFFDTLVHTLPETEPAVWKHFRGYAGLSDAAAKEVLAIGEYNPEVWFTDLGLNIYGAFLPRQSNYIQLNKHAAQALENRQDEECRQFMMQLLLHEMVHWAKNVSEDPHEDLGDKFETAAFGGKKDRIFDETTRESNSGVSLRSSDQGHDITGSDLPRGLRCNNPCMIRKDRQPAGMTPYAEMTVFQRRETEIAVFTFVHFGLRAGFELLLSFMHDVPTLTPAILARRWSDYAGHADTAGFKDRLARGMKVGADDPLPLDGDAHLFRVMELIIAALNDGMGKFTETELSPALTNARSSP